MKRFAFQLCRMLVVILPYSILHAQGTNVNAYITLDLSRTEPLVAGDSSVTQLESVSAGDSIWMKMYVYQAVNLEGFAFTVNIDTAYVEYIDVDYNTSIETNFIEPVQLGYTKTFQGDKLYLEGLYDITKYRSVASSPDGHGFLGQVLFRMKNTFADTLATRIIFTKVTFWDRDGHTEDNMVTPPEASINPFFIPVEMAAFSVTPSGRNGGELVWETLSETNNYGFEIYHSSNGAVFRYLDFIRGHGTTDEPQRYSYAVHNLPAGVHTFYLKQIDFDGSFEKTQSVTLIVGAPRDYALYQNYPNPFNPVTTIAYDVKKPGKVSLAVYNVLGQRVRQLVNESQPAGYYTERFDLSDLASGIYVYRLQVNEYVDIKKMVVVK